MPLLRFALALALAICLLMQQPLLTISADVIADHKSVRASAGPTVRPRAPHGRLERKHARDRWLSWACASFAAWEVEESNASSDKSTEQVKEKRQPLKRKVSTASYDSGKFFFSSYFTRFGRLNAFLEDVLMSSSEVSWRSLESISNVLV